MSAATRTADLLTIAVFVLTVAGIGGYSLFKTHDKNSPKARIRDRAAAISLTERAPKTVAIDPNAASGRRYFSESPVAKAWLSWKSEILRVGNWAGLNGMAGVAVVAIIATPIIARMAGLPLWMGLLAMPVVLVLAVTLTYRWLVARFSAKFLAGLPEALDIIIRAVRAGIPAVQAIRTASKELPDPVGREFRLIADALRLGQDQNEVMTAAAARINLPDFSFFTVCLQLQRETGGPLAETLENLSAIIRARREVMLKTRALSAQGRMSSKIIAMVPIMTTGALRLAGGNYLDVLFDTPAGHRVLWIATGMVVTGMVVTARMAKLED